jgi:hypothetical protein
LPRISFHSIRVTLTGTAENISVCCEVARQISDEISLVIPRRCFPRIRRCQNFGVRARRYTGSNQAYKHHKHGSLIRARHTRSHMMKKFQIDKLRNALNACATIASVARIERQRNPGFSRDRSRISFHSIRATYRPDPASRRRCTSAITASPLAHGQPQ